MTLNGWRVVKPQHNQSNITEVSIGIFSLLNTIPYTTISKVLGITWFTGLCYRDNLQCELDTRHSAKHNLSKAITVLIWNKGTVFDANTLWANMYKVCCCETVSTANACLYNWVWFKDIEWGKKCTLYEIPHKILEPRYIFTCIYVHCTWKSASVQYCKHFVCLLLTEKHIIKCFWNFDFLGKK